MSWFLRFGISPQNLHLRQVTSSSCLSPNPIALAIPWRDDSLCWKQNGASLPTLPLRHLIIRRTYHWAHKNCKREKGQGGRINSLKAYSKKVHWGQLHKQISVLDTIISETHYLNKYIHSMGFKYILRRKFYLKNYLNFLSVLLLRWQSTHNKQKRLKR